MAESQAGACSMAAGSRRSIPWNEVLDEARAQPGARSQIGAESASRPSRSAISTISACPIAPTCSAARCTPPRACSPGLAMRSEPPTSRPEVTMTDPLRQPHRPAPPRHRARCRRSSIEPPGPGRRDRVSTRAACADDLASRPTQPRCVQGTARRSRDGAVRGWPSTASTPSPTTHPASSGGFKDEDGGPSSNVEVPGADDPLLASNLSVWTDLRVVAGVHVSHRPCRRICGGGRSGSNVRQTPMTVGWWIPAGTLPTLVEALDRLERLRSGRPVG